MKIAVPLVLVLAALTLAACGGGGSSSTESAGEETTSPGPAEGGKEAGGNLAAGKEVFAQNCATCHGATGHGGGGGPDLRTMPKAQSVEGTVEQVTNGGAAMPAFKGILSPQEIKDVATYVAKGING
jgi:mono/diheme cytochrome c family protein